MNDFDYNVYEYRRIDKGSDEAKKILGASAKNFAQGHSGILLKYILFCMFLLLTLIIIIIATSKKPDKPMNTSYRYDPKNYMFKAMEIVKEEEENIPDKYKKDSNDSLLYMRVKGEASRLAHQEEEEDNKKYNEQRAVMIQEQNKGMVRMTVVCTILASIGIGIYGICIGLYYMLKRNKKIEIAEVVMINRDIMIDSDEKENYAIKVRGKGRTVEDAIMENTSEEVCTIIVNKYLYNSYEEGKKGYIVKWSGNNMKEIPDDERVKRNIEFLM